MEPVSAYPEKLSDQIADNRAIIEDVEKKMTALQSIKENVEEILKNDKDSASSKGGILFDFVSIYLQFQQF